MGHKEGQKSSTLEEAVFNVEWKRVAEKADL